MIETFLERKVTDEVRNFWIKVFLIFLREINNSTRLGEGFVYIKIQDVSD